MKSESPLIYIRPDDGEVFSLNEDGETYSLLRIKVDFPESLQQKYHKEEMEGSGFVPIDDLTNPLVKASEYTFKRLGKVRKKLL